VIERIDSKVGRQALFSVASTRRIEATALSTRPAFALMARAGDAVARLALALGPHARKILVVAGPGNNGGDGIEAATRLCEMGKPASILLFADPTALPGDAAHALTRAKQVGVSIAIASANEEPERGAPDLVVDALLGIGASRPPAGRLLKGMERIAQFAAQGARVLAIDVPSGLDADQGQPFGDACVIAHDTLTLLTAKPGLFTAAGRDHAGTIWLDALGLDLAAESADAWLVGHGELGRFDLARLHAQHKGSFGDVAIVGGASGMAGAAVLAARAAHAAGAGRVFLDLLAEPATSAAFDPMRPELMLRKDWWQGPVDSLTHTTVVCGCGGGDAARAALPRLLSLAPRLVLDADALNAIATDPGLRTMVAARAARSLETILTPHPLEAARLLGVSTREVQDQRLGAASQLAERYMAVVVLKGSGSIIVAPGERPRISATGNASLATAGTGDVLAGWIGGRWLPGAAAYDAATRGVIEHGAAAEPEQPGPLRAADLIERLYLRSRDGA
jgi:hydroxyethylthiazole kinase-like uncharacterized protein yjeF